MHRYVFLCLLAVSTPLFASEAAQAEDVLTIRKQGPLLIPGTGFDKVTGEEHGTCIGDTSYSTDTRNLSQDIDVDITKSSTDLSYILGINAYASAFGGFSKFSSSFGMQNSDDRQVSTEHLYIKVSVTGAVSEVRNPVPTADVISLLDDPQLFAQTCGDSFVSQVEEGGEFLAIIDSKTIDDQTLQAFKADFNASFAVGEAGAAAQSRVSKIASDYSMTAHIVQIGASSNQVPSLVDFSALLRHALAFTSDIKASGETVPYLAHFKKYTLVPAFQKALRESKSRSIINFDGSQDIMEQYISAYYVALQRSQLTLDALNHPESYLKYDHNILEPYEKIIRDEVNNMRGLATDCASKIRSGDPCISDTGISLEITPMPLNLKRIPSCLASEQNANCTRAEFSEEQGCRCSRCEFLRSKIILSEGNYEHSSCKNMPAGRTVNASFVGNYGIASGGISPWIMFFFNGIKSDDQAPSGEFTNTFYATGKTNESGVFDVDTGFYHCQSSNATRDICYIASSGQTPMVTIEAGPPSPPAP